MNPTAITTWADLRWPLEVNGSASQKPLAVATLPSQYSSGWQDVLSGPLAGWAKNPGQLEDDGIEPPNREIIQRASDLARQLCALGLPAPQRAAATGDGGIVFARQEGSFFSSIEVASDGSIELTVFRESKLVSRQRLG